MPPKPPPSNKNHSRQRRTEEFRNFSTNLQGRLARIVQQDDQQQPAGGTRRNPIPIDDNEPHQQPRHSFLHAQDTTNNGTPNNLAQQLGLYFNRASNRPAGHLSHQPDWPVVTSDVRSEPQPNALPVTLPSPPATTPAPPGPTDAHFVYADERDAYLARCPPNVDFSQASTTSSSSSSCIPPANPPTQTIFMPTTRTGRAPAVPPTRPPPALDAAQARQMLNRFIAAAHAQQQQQQQRAPPAPPHPHALPHLDAQDASDPAHYLHCEVCRGIRARAIPDEHEFWGESGAAAARPQMVAQPRPNPASALPVPVPVPAAAAGARVLRPTRR